MSIHVKCTKKLFSDVKKLAANIFKEPKPTVAKQNLRSVYSMHKYSV